MVNGVSQHSNNLQVTNPGQVTNADLKEETTLKPNTLKNRIMSAYQKTTSAFIEYLLFHPYFLQNNPLFV